MWSFREARTDDVPRMRELYDECTVLQWNCVPNRGDENAKVVETLVTGEHLHTTVLEEDGTIVGFISMWTPTEPVDVAVGDALVIDLKRFKTKPQRREAVARIISSMWRIMAPKGRTRIKTDLTMGHIEAIQLLTGFRIISDHTLPEKVLDLSTNAALAWADTEGY